MEEFDVIVVGAGSSGLYAATKLQEWDSKIRLLVVEGSNYYGGRVKTDESFAFPMRIAEGAEFIHGDYAGHLLREFVIQHEWPLELKKWPNYYWFSGSNSFVLASDRPEVNEMMRLLAKTKLSDIPTGVDSLLEFLKTKHFSLTQINSIVPLVNDWGGELQMIGVRDMVEMFKNEIWDDEGV
eukprot:TRINITY_DN5179_c0_g1_i14.p2 TRINITY_DN5179_c0_g1~~TRINITY_DN5179_c0_g1_i14.p2  ORF type:complete len:182 (+),score=31.21 TRINITY_DN5179_c0_g1_i14:79-624(+)